MGLLRDRIAKQPETDRPDTDAPDDGQEEICAQPLTTPMELKRTNDSRHTTDSAEKKQPACKRIGLYLLPHARLEYTDPVYQLL